tara:strand:+ start:1751 stop:2011 length:261 start_codon:yes stop_codon:yes gene_type:complete
MNIEFKDAVFLGETTEINLPIMVNGQSIICIVTFEALEDINPETKTDEPMQQYLSNESQLKSIAERKIRNGQVTSNKVIIYSADVI